MNAAIIPLIRRRCGGRERRVAAACPTQAGLYACAASRVSVETVEDGEVGDAEPRHQHAKETDNRSVGGLSAAPALVDAQMEENRIDDPRN
jgi:hypothetical protein